MARASRLKVYRTPIGFHDAYVAAPSRAAALRAWGAERDLFARGQAEEVTDPALTADALAKPGEVIRRSRGTVAEQLAALPADRAKPDKPMRRKSPPEPDRTTVDDAEAALATAQSRAKRVMRDFDERAATLARERQKAEREVRDEARRLEQALDRAAAAYDRAMAAWRAG